MEMTGVWGYETYVYAREKKDFYEKVGKSGVFFVLGCHVRAGSFFLRVFFIQKFC